MIRSSNKVWQHICNHQCIIMSNRRSVINNNKSSIYFSLVTNATVFEKGKYYKQHACNIIKLITTTCIRVVNNNIN